MSINKFLSLLALSIILLIAAVFRLYKLDWGNGHFFHPDENNIAGLITSLDQKSGSQFFLQGTFSYGTSLDYTVYFALKQANRFGLCQQSEYACVSLMLRFLAALASFLTVILVYWLASKLWGEKWGLVAAFIAAVSPGLIQTAHFGTFESVLTFLFLASLAAVYHVTRDGKLTSLFWATLPLVVAGSLKINSLILLPLPFLAYFIKNNWSVHLKANFKENFLYATLLILILVASVPLLSPYYLTDDFRGMFKYEQGVVTGSLPVFYTRQFASNNNLIFPVKFIYPYLANPLILFFATGFIILLLFKVYLLIKNRLRQATVSKIGGEIFIALYLLALLIPSLLLFTKWSRYFLPTLPFLILSTTGLLANISKRLGFFLHFFTVVLIISSLLQGVAFFSIYERPDSRLQASTWIYQQIPNGQTILSETANVVDIPIFLPTEPAKILTVIPFDFYNLDQDPTLPPKLYQALAKANYIFIPSRRIFMNMAQTPEAYPMVYRYYQLLFSGQLGYRPIATFTSYPTISVGSIKIEIPDEEAEETWTVFDHPVIRIYQKERQFSEQDYARLFEN